MKHTPWKSLVGNLAVQLMIAACASLFSSALVAAEVTYYHTDGLGSVVAVTDAAGNVIERREYEPYGTQLRPATTNGPGYTGHVHDAATGLVYMQQRYYDPSLGRFLSVDPVTADPNTGGNFNRYWYANNNPYKFKDPDGRQSTSVERAIDRDVKDYASGDISKAEYNDRALARGAGAAGAATLVATGAVAVESGAVAVTAAGLGKAADAVGKVAVAAESGYASVGIAAYAKGTDAAQAVAARAGALATVVSAKAGEAKVVVMTSPATVGAMKHMNKIVDAIEGYFNPSPPPMTPAGVTAAYAAGVAGEVDD